jgi:DNA-binding CsgD family transcriptional regulator
LNTFKITDFTPYYALYPELSDVQLKVFVLYNNYISHENIKLQLNITDNTLYAHLKCIRNKYHVNSTSELKNVYNRRKEAYFIHIFGEVII